MSSFLKISVSSVLFYCVEILKDYISWYMTYLLCVQTISRINSTSNVQCISEIKIMDFK